MNVIKKLEDQASKIDCDKPTVGTGLATLFDNIHLYEEAVLARKPPVLKLPVIKTRDLTGSANSNRGAGSILFPSISQSTRASPVGGSVANHGIQRQQRTPTNLNVFNSASPQNDQRVAGIPSDIAIHSSSHAQVGGASSLYRSRTMAPPSNHVNATSLSQALAHVTKKMFGGTRNVPSQQSPTLGVSSSQKETTAAAKTSTTSLGSKGVSGAVDVVFTRAKDWDRGRSKHKRKRQDKYDVAMRSHETESRGSRAGTAEDGDGASGSGSGSGELTYSESRSSFSSRDGRRNFGRQISRTSSFSSRAGNHSAITGSMGANTNSAQNSRPSSWLGTASSHGGGGGAGGGSNGVVSSRPFNISAPSSQRQLPNSHSMPNPRLSSAPSPSRSFAFSPPPHSFQTQPRANFQPGSLPSDSILSPTSANSTSPSYPLVTTLSYTGIHSATSPPNRERPDYRRLALQTLEPSPSRRPHLRRGDANFNLTLKDQGNDSAVDEFELESEGLSDAGGSESASGNDLRTHGKGAGALGYEHKHGANASARRMSAPAATAPRMMMRMPVGGGGGN